jgi:hypothetical protein
LVVCADALGAGIHHLQGAVADDYRNIFIIIAIG